MRLYKAADRVSEEANEIIVIDSITENIIDKIAEEVAEFLVEQPIEAIQAVERPTKKLRDPGSNPARIKTYNCLETERI